MIDELIHGEIIKYCNSNRPLDLSHEAEELMRHGAKIVMDLELPVKFNDWILYSSWRFSDEKKIWEDLDDKNDDKTTSELFEWWLENIYTDNFKQQ